MLTVDGPGRGSFRLRPDAINVEWIRGRDSAPLHFFAHALPLWLEARGVPVLHASAVSLKGRALAFIGRTGAGKSTLCAGLMRSGCDFVADDVLALTRTDSGVWRCHFGPPAVRLWPSALVDCLKISPEELPRVSESLDKRRLPVEVEGHHRGEAGLELGGIYVLDRRTEEHAAIDVSGIGAADALAFLIQHSLAGAPMAALGLSVRQLEQLSAVVERTPVRRLGYPNGDNQWPAIRDRVFEAVHPPRPQPGKRSR